MHAIFGKEFDVCIRNQWTDLRTKRLAVILSSSLHSIPFSGYKAFPFFP